MKKLSLSILSLFAGIFISSGQPVYKLDKDTSNFKKRPVYILKRPLQNNLETTNMVLDPGDIDSINVYKYPQGEKSYQQMGKTDVVEIILKNGSSLINYGQLLTHFSIDNKNRDLPLYIDSAIAYHPEKTYFELAGVKYVKIAIDEETGMQYISLRTNSSINRNGPPIILDDPDKKNK